MRIAVIGSALILLLLVCQLGPVQASGPPSIEVSATCVIDGEEFNLPKVNSGDDPSASISLLRELCEASGGHLSLIVVGVDAGTAGNG